MREVLVAFAAVIAFVLLYMLARLVLPLDLPLTNMIATFFAR